MRSLEEIRAANDLAVKKAQDARKLIETSPTVKVTRTKHAPSALFLSESWLNAEDTTDDGIEFRATITRTLSGGAIVLTIDFEDNGTHRIVETIRMKNLVTEWINEALKTRKEN